MNGYSKSELDRLNAITDKRPSTVIQHILKHGSITTEEIETLYGYKHPPRAIRDVRERGVNLETYRVISSDGRSIGAYRFGHPLFVEDKTAKTAGRTFLSQAIKKALIGKYGPRCFVHNKKLDGRVLQIDHRIPYEIGGEPADNDLDAYMLLSPSANRTKSWTCEHCPNWTEKDKAFCTGCFWAHPESYTHIAGKAERHIIVMFTGNEVEDYDRLIALVGKEQAEATIKKLVGEFIADKD